MDITNAAIAVSQPNYFIHQVDSSEEAQSYRHNLARAFEQTMMGNDSDRQSSLDAADSLQESLTKPGVIEYIATYLRIRPLLEEEKKEQGSHEYFTVEDDKFVVTHPAPPLRTYTTAQRELFEPQRFEFKRIFKPDSTQHTIFENCVVPLMNNVMAEGITMNPLFLTYGETSSGKSYTVFGSSAHPGVVPRALSHLFERIGSRLWLTSLFRPSFGADIVELSRAEMEAELSTRAELLKSTLLTDSNKAADHKSTDSATTSSSSTSQCQQSVNTNTCYQVWMSCLEIYNETIYDLLDAQIRPIRHAVRYGQRGNSDSGTTIASGESIKRTTVELRTDKRGLVFPRNVRYALITSISDAERYVELARANLQISKTALNAASSRSHAVFTLKIVKVPVAPQQCAAGSNADLPLRRCGPPRLASIAFCDLAGSERASKAHSVTARDAMPTRLFETGNINTSLLTLKLCIDALRSNQRAANSGGNEPQKMVPYRASKLTRLFSNYFCFDRAVDKDKDKQSQKGNGFNSQMVVLTTIAPSAKLFNESVQILDFATIAKEVITSSVKADEPMPPFVEPTPSEVDLRKVKSIAIVPSAPTRESIAFESETTKKLSNVHDPNLKRLERVEEDEDEEDDNDQDSDEVQPSDAAVNKPVEKPHAAAASKHSRAAAPFQQAHVNTFSFKPPQPVTKKNRGVVIKLPTASGPAATARSHASENSIVINAQKDALAAQSGEVSRQAEEIARLKAELSRTRMHLASRDRENARLRAEAERQESRLRQELFAHYDKIIMDQRARYERRIELLCDRLEEHNEQRIESMQQAFRRREQQEGCRAAKRRRTSLESDAD